MCKLDCYCTLQTVTAIAVTASPSGEDPQLPGAKLRLAAHLCGQDCLRQCFSGVVESQGYIEYVRSGRALAGDVAHISGLHALLGFGRAQLNPTKVG